jgi:PASTA domain-containing protein
MTTKYADYFQQEVPDIRTGGPYGPLICADGRYRVISARPPRRRRRLGRSRGAWPAVIVVALIVGGVSLISGPLTAALSSSPGHSTKSPNAARGASATNRTQAPTAAPHISVKCATPTAGPFANIALPDVVGQNAKTASEQLQQLGVTNVELASATPEYQLVIVRSNWTVVSTSPAPCAVINPSDHVVLKVTKPSGGFGNFFDGPLSRFGQSH